MKRPEQRTFLAENADVEQDTAKGAVMGTGWRVPRHLFSPAEHEDEILARAYVFILSWTDKEQEKNSESTCLNKEHLTKA